MAEHRVAVDPLTITKRWIETSPRGDWVTGLRDKAQIERMQAFLDDHAAPDLEIEAMAGGDPGLVPASRGGGGLLEFWHDWLEPWESFHVDVEGVYEGSEGVVIEVVQRGRLRGSVAEVETPSAAVHFFREGLMRRIEFHLDRETARQAAGL
jgi:ketosteroid isomerase-like protein